ncbi:hypothetical protein D9611_009191 [Ephemerocybe angulata]|uniref:Uncharacterized protein n=1 Tax=Ephemerocybe angulata TaxID=980116 RepID=A0A8H5FKC4_9AGAR|nr:hypothetical protein D9611_009191 [Tulosesus angulatus]
MPLGDTDFDAILGFGLSSRTKVEGVCEIDARDVQTSCTTWKASLDAGTKSILSRMKAKARHRSTLVSLSVVPPGEAHTLNLTPVSKNHFATLIAVLPSPRTGATFETRYREHKSHHNLSNVTPNSTHLLGLYTGMASAVIKSSGDRLCFLTYHVQCPPRTTSIPSIRNVAGPRTEIATAFASWAHALSTNTKAPGIPSNHIIYQLDGVYRNNVVATGLTNRKDRLVLAHLAPAAKHFGFKMVLAHADVHLTYSTTRVSTDDKEVEQVSAYVEDETEWEFCPLGRKEPCDNYAYHEVIDALKERGPCINYHAGYKSFDKNALETLGKCPF